MYLPAGDFATIDVNIDVGPSLAEYRARVLELAEPGGVTAAVVATGEARTALVLTGVVRALQLVDRKTAVAIAKQATPSELKAILDDAESILRLSAEAGLQPQDVVDTLEAGRPTSSRIPWLLLGAVGVVWVFTRKG